MTSSLVGSEMCIRDSDKIGAGGAFMADVSQNPEERPRCRAWIQTLATVSYTHLTLPTICSV
eukprot:2750533-Prorocentrum_lima.AAC.1